MLEKTVKRKDLSTSTDTQGDAEEHHSVFCVMADTRKIAHTK